jgi:hypothetical protein
MKDVAQEPNLAPPLNEAAVALRRETTLKRMLATPHVPHDALAEMRRVSKPRPRKPRAPVQTQ